MKNNRSMVWVIAISTVAICSLGFDWTPKKEQKSAPVAPTASSMMDSPAAADLSFPQMMGRLSQNMSVWTALTPENKKKAIEAAVLLYQNRQNTAILRPVDFYVTQIDQSLSSNPAFLATDLMSLVKILAVIEYDFYNGQDKDALAKEVLGEKLANNIRQKRQQQIAAAQA